MPKPVADLPARLARRLALPLPGYRVQARYQPGLSYGRHFGPAPASARAAAVLVLLYPAAEKWWLPLTVRPDHLTDHAGQISLPGGRIEPSESPERAALRELEEELGVGATNIEMLGELSPIYLYRSNFAIQPCVAVSRSLPAWRPNASEVAELLEIPVDALRSPSATRVEQRSQSGISFSAPAMIWAEHAIWGATAMILAELIALVEETTSVGPEGKP